MGFFIFTFHDVSINTHHTASDRGYIPVFTFHDVSINTDSSTFWTYMNTSLHSTMFLLIHRENGAERISSFLYIPRCFY